MRYHTYFICALSASTSSFTVLYNKMLYFMCESAVFKGFSDCYHGLLCVSLFFKHLTCPRSWFPFTNWISKNCVKSARNNKNTIIQKHGLLICSAVRGTSYVEINVIVFSEQTITCQPLFAKPKFYIFAGNVVYFPPRGLLNAHWCY